MSTQTLAAETADRKALPPELPATPRAPEADADTRAHEPLELSRQNSPGRGLAFLPCLICRTAVDLADIPPSPLRPVLCTEHRPAANADQASGERSTDA